VKRLIIIIFLGFVNSLFSQEAVTFIYIDNSITINRALQLSNQVRNVIENSNRNGLLVLGQSPVENENEEPNYNSYKLNDEELLSNLKSICLRDTESQRPEEIFKILTIELGYNSLEVIMVNSDNKPFHEKPLELHLFFNVSTFVRRDLVADVLEQLKLVGAVKSKLNVTVHLDYVNDKKQFNEYIIQAEQDSSLKININRY
jgi:hypothetical protein